MPRASAASLHACSDVISSPWSHTSLALPPERAFGPGGNLSPFSSSSSSSSSSLSSSLSSSSSSVFRRHSDSSLQQSQQQQQQHRWLRWKTSHLLLRATRPAQLRLRGRLEDQRLRSRRHGYSTRTHACCWPNRVAPAAFWLRRCFARRPKSDTSRCGTWRGLDALTR